MALPSRFRLRKKKEIDEVFKSGRLIRGSFFFVKYLKKEQREKRIAIIISNKIVPLASRRNLFRRKISAEIYGVLDKISQYFDLVLVLSSPRKKLEKKEIKEIREVFSRLS